VKAMVLAAGKGERMLPMTMNTPKPLLQVGGHSLISHQLQRLAENGITDIVINHSWLGEQIEMALGDGSEHSVDIAWSQEEEPLETAGGIIQALPLLMKDAVSASFISVNADIWTDYPYKKLHSLDDSNLLAWLVLVDNPPHHPEGDFVLNNDRVTESESSQQTLTFSGISVFHPALFEGVAPGKHSVVPLLKQAMVEGRVGGEYYQGQWFDIGTPERLQALDEILTD